MNQVKRLYYKLDGKLFKVFMYGSPADRFIRLLSLRGFDYSINNEGMGTCIEIDMDEYWDLDKFIEISTILGYVCFSSGNF